MNRYGRSSRKRSSFTNEDLEINNIEANSSSPDKNRNRAKERQRRVRFEHPIVQVQNRYRSLRQERIARIGNPQKATTCRQPNARLFTPSKEVATKANIMALKEMEKERKHQLNQIDKLPLGSDLNTSFVPHYRNSFPHHPPLPSEASKQSLLLRTSFRSSADDLGFQDLRFEDSSTDNLTSGKMISTSRTTVSDEPGIIDTKPIEKTNDQSENKLAASPRNANNLGNINLRVHSHRNHESKLKKINKSCSASLFDLDEDEGSPFQRLRISKNSDGTYNHERDDNNFSSFSEENALLGSPDWPEPDTDDMSIHPHFMTYHGAVSGKAMTQTPAEFWDEREKLFIRAKAKIAAQRMAKEMTSMGSANTECQEEYDAKRLRNNERGPRDQAMTYGWEEKHARHAHSRHGYEYGQSHGHGQGQGDSGNSELMTSPKRKRGQSNLDTGRGN